MAVLFGVLVGAAIAAASAGTTVGTRNYKGSKVLVSQRGFSLYLFVKDKGKNSTCYGNCAKVWPPLLTNGKPGTARGSGLNPRLLGTTRRSSGKTEVTYNGHPLYLYVADHKPGDVHGQNINQFGAKWYLVNKAGNAVKPKGGVCNPLCPGY
jgi:predicted lipoprotein with Yx(FWY)xxD motif